MTTELLIEPPTANIDTFDWRISAANVGTSGPFSKFAGRSRTLLLLEGDGMTLNHGTHGTSELPRTLQPVVVKT